MKKSFIFLSLVLIAHAVVGQKWSLSFGPESKSLHYLASNAMKTTGFIGADASTIFLQGYTNDRHAKPYLVAYDYALQELRRVDLPNSDNSNYYGGFLNEGSIDLLMTENSKSSLKAYKLSYDPVSFSKKGEPVELVSLSGGGSKYTLVSSSQSQEWLGIFFTVVQDDDAEWVVGLYDTKLDELWRMEFHMDAIHDFFVSDTGDVVAAGYFKKDKSDETSFTFAVLDGEKDMKYFADEAVPELATMEIVRYESGKIYCTGLLTGEKQQGADRWYSGVYSLVYDTKSKRVSKFDTVLFSKDDICDLCNVSRRNKLKKISTDKLGFASSSHDGDGATVVYERVFDFYINHEFTYTDYVGFLAYRIAADGSIVWHNVVKREIKAAFGVDNGVRTKLYPTKDGYTVFYVDGKSNLDIKPTSTASTLSLNQAKMSLMGVNLSNDGSVSRFLLDIPSKSVPLGTPHLVADNEYLLIMLTPFRSCAGKLIFK